MVKRSRVDSSYLLVLDYEPLHTRVAKSVRAQRASSASPRAVSVWFPVVVRWHSLFRARTLVHARETFVLRLRVGSSAWL